MQLAEIGKREERKNTALSQQTLVATLLNVKNNKKANYNQHSFAASRDELVSNKQREARINLNQPDN